MTTDWNDIKQIHRYVFTELKDISVLNEWKEIVKKGYISQYPSLEKVPRIDWRLLSKRDINKLFKLSDKYLKPS